MSPAKDANLQVRIDAALLAEFRHYAEGSGTTMSQMVLRWIRGAVGGDGEPASVEGGGVMQGDDRGEELVVLGRRQVELLERLVASAEKPVIPDVTPAAGTAEAAVVQPAPVVPTPAPPEAEGVDVLAAQRARQLAEMELWKQQKAVENQAAAEAERVKAVEAAGHHTPADVAPLKKKKGDAVFAQQLKEAAAAALEGAGMGGQQDASAEGSVSDQGVVEPAVQEPAVLPQVTDDGVVDVIATPADPGDGDLLKRVEALEQQERLMEDWLAAIRDGGDPVAPPLPADASEQEWEAAATDCLEARGKKPLPELITAVLKHWGRG